MQTTLKVGDSSVEVEYQLAAQVVVFSHGFGVRRDSRGLFTAIAAGLPSGWGYVLFDYDSFDSVTNQQRVVGLTARAERLEAVLDWVRKQSDVQAVHLIGHSMGTLTLANLAPDGIGKMILLAPPLKLGSRFVESYTERSGATHEGHTWSIPRSDGTTTVVDDEPLAELVSIDAEGELAKLALFRDYTIVIAGTDQTLPDEDYTELIVMPSVSMVGVERADHDFSGPARVELLRIVVGLLTNDETINQE